MGGTVRDECLNLHSFTWLAEAWVRLSIRTSSARSFTQHRIDATRKGG